MICFNLHCFAEMDISRWANDFFMSTKNSSLGKDTFIFWTFWTHDRLLHKSIPKICFFVSWSFFRSFYLPMHFIQCQSAIKFVLAIQIFEILLFHTYTVSRSFSETSYFSASPVVSTKRLRCLWSVSGRLLWRIGNADRQPSKPAHNDNYTVAKAWTHASISSKLGNETTHFKEISITSFQNSSLKSAQDEEEAKRFYPWDGIFWLNQKKKKAINAHVSEQIVRKHGSCLQTKTDKTLLPFSKQLDLVFSNRWIGRI